MMKKEFLASLRDDISFYNPKSTKRTRKISTSSMDDQISKLDSYIGELYKRYSKTKKTRLREEKSEQYLLNRINYLTLEEKKLRDEIMNNSKLNLKKFYKTKYNTCINTPRIKSKRTKSTENLFIKNSKDDLSNISNNDLYDLNIKKEKSIIKFKENMDKHKLSNSLILEPKTTRIKDSIKNIVYNQPNDTGKKKYVTNNICIIINKNEEKGKKNNYYKKLNLSINKSTLINKKINKCSSIGTNINGYKYKKNMKNGEKLNKSTFSSPLNEKTFINKIIKKKKELETSNKNLKLKNKIIENNSKDFQEIKKDKSKKYLFNKFNIVNNNGDTNTNTYNSKLDLSQDIKSKINSKNNNDLLSQYSDNSNQKINNYETKTNNMNSYIFYISKHNSKKFGENSLNNSSLKNCIEKKRKLMGLALNNKENKIITKKIKDDIINKIGKEKNNDNDNSTDYKKDKINSNNKTCKFKYEKYKTHNNDDKDGETLKENTINKNVVRRLFLKNKNNKSNEFINKSNYQKEKNIIVNESLLKSQIMTIRRINLQIENLKKNNFMERKKKIEYLKKINNKTKSKVSSSKSKIKINKQYSYNKNLNLSTIN
jgi:hypothetical protein